MTIRGAGEYPIQSHFDLGVFVPDPPLIPPVHRFQQMEMADEFPDIVIGCAGGGSNFAGLAYPSRKKGLNKTAESLSIVGARDENRTRTPIRAWDFK